MQTTNEEKVVWSGTPSQALHFGTYALCVLLSPLVIPIFIALAKYLQTRAHKYELTSERLLISRGVFSKTTDGLELYRVKDGRVEEPFFLRLFGAGNVILMTSDKTHPVVVLEAVPAPAKIWESVRAQVEAMRVKKGIRDVDVS